MTWSTSPHSAGDDSAEYLLAQILETLQQLEPGVQGAFLQKFLKGLAGVDVSEQDSVGHWQEILRRRKEMKERLGRDVAFQTAAADYFSSAPLFRNLAFLDYQELKRLRFDAATDPLTGLFNRRLFEEYMMRELNRSRRHPSPFVLLLIDLRDFKRANDTYGHSVGDQILQVLARACVETVRGSDYAFRIGGDEFALLLPQTESQIAHLLARRITHKFEQYARTVAPALTIGLDYGVAAFPKDGESFEKLFETADRNVYTQKKDEVLQERAESKPELGPPETPAEARPNSATEQKRQNQRRHSRIPLAATGALAVLHDNFGKKEVSLLDLSLGGFSFVVDEVTGLPEFFQAQLHVSSFQSNDVRTRRVYTRLLPQGLNRVGCSFAN